MSRSRRNPRNRKPLTPNRFGIVRLARDIGMIGPRRALQMALAA